MNTTTSDLPLRPLKWPIFVLCIVALLLSDVWMPEYPTAEEAWGYGLRVTARVAFIYLMLAYLARPLKQLFGIGVLFEHRRYLGLAMAFAHTVHFVCVVVVLVRYSEPLDPIVLIGGGGAFVVM